MFHIPLKINGSYQIRRERSLFIKKFCNTIMGSNQWVGEIAWASLVAQKVKKSCAMQETWVWSLCQEDRLEKGMTTHSSILA